MTTKTIPVRQLGKDGPSVPALGLGLMGISVAYGTAPNDEERFRLLDHALEQGNTFWDTSDMYGDNEVVLGKWFKRTGKRDQIFLASKFGILFDGKKFDTNSTGEYCKKACDASLERLGIDSIDLYYAHRLDPQVPIEETMRALAELQRQGKIKHIGLSEVSSTTLRRACKIAQVACVQMEYSAVVLDIEQESGTNLLKTCRELGVAVVAYSPLGRGLLTGAYRTTDSISGANDMRGSMYPRFSEKNLEPNLKFVDWFTAKAEKKGCTTSQLAMAWLLKQGDDIIPIPGTKKIKYLDENWGTLNVHLSDAEDAEIRKFVESAEIGGARSINLGLASFADTKEES